MSRRTDLVRRATVSGWSRLALGQELPTCHDGCISGLVGEGKVTQSSNTGNDVQSLAEYDVERLDVGLIALVGAIFSQVRRDNP
jgi:hypothetical protein